MKAAVYRHDGAPEVLRIEEVAKPVPKDDEVLIRIKASTVSAGDMRARSLDMPAGFGLFARPVFGFFGPRQRILGTELAGEIEAVGEEVLIVGASGAVGSAAVQLAKHFGARVTAVTSTPNVERVTNLGADCVIDYKTTQILEDGKQYDLIFDTVGSGDYAFYRAALKEEGRLLLCGASLPQMIKSKWEASETVERLRMLKELVASGRYRPLIDRSYPLEQIAEAHAYVDTGRKRGSVVITIA